MVSKLPLWTKGLFLGALMVLVLAACGSDPTPTPRPTSTPTPTPTLAPGVPTPTPAPATATPTPSPTPSFDAAAYFKGKTIRLVANSSPGGGTDAQGRVMAAYIGKYIPGKPRIVFQNQPNKPKEYVYSATEAPKDGTYISWNSTPELDYGFTDSGCCDANGEPIKRSTFQFIGATISATRSWTTYDPVKNLGAEAATKCLWDFAGQSSTGGGDHNAFYLADEISDVESGTTQVVANLYVLDALKIPFKYFAFDTVDTNAVYTMWARGDIDTTVRNSLWYRFPLEHPDWIPNGLIRVYASMGPGTLKANAQAEPACGYIGDHMSAEDTATYKAIMNPPNYMSKSLWMPPGTPDNIADVVSQSIQTAFETDQDLLTKYGAIAGEQPDWTTREDGTQQTKENEDIFVSSQQIVADESKRLLEKYFPQYVAQ